MDRDGPYRHATARPRSRLWVLGPQIDSFGEPVFRKLAPVGGRFSAELEKVQRRYLSPGAAATGLFDVIVLVWLLG